MREKTAALRDIEYERQLDINVRIRAQYWVTRGRVRQFTVQLEVLAQGQWQPAVRYDTAHRFAHRDLYRPGGQVIKTNLKMTFEEALTHALNDLSDNWELYRDRFSEG